MKKTGTEHGHSRGERTFGWTPGGFLQCERQRAKFCGFVKLVVSFRDLK